MDEYVFRWLRQIVVTDDLLLLGCFKCFLSVILGKENYENRGKHLVLIEKIAFKKIKNLLKYLDGTDS